MPELITICWSNGRPYQAIYGVQGAMEIFNPSEPKVYTVMEEILKEVNQQFPSEYIHLGMSMQDSFVSFRLEIDLIT